MNDVPLVPRWASPWLVLLAIGLLLPPSFADAAPKRKGRKADLGQEPSVVTDLKAIHRGGMNYLYVMRFREEPTFEKLIEYKMLSPEFAEGVKGPYRFTLETKGTGVEVRAIPISSDSGLKSWWIDEGGAVHEEDG